MMKNVILSAAALVLAAGLSAPASAVPLAPKAAAIAAENASVVEVGHRDCRRCDRDGRRYYRKGRDRSSFSLNFSFGSPGYYAAPRYYAPPVYYQAPVAWTPAWYTYCKTKYRSFNPHTGYYMTHSSGWQLCR